MERDGTTCTPPSQAASQLNVPIHQNDLDSAKRQKSGNDRARHHRAVHDRKVQRHTGGPPDVRRQSSAAKSVSGSAQLNKEDEQGFCEQDVYKTPHSPRRWTAAREATYAGQLQKRIHNLGNNTVVSVSAHKSHVSPHKRPSQAK